MTAPRLGFGELVDGQAIPETSVNEMARFLEQGAGHFIFQDRDLATPPGSPAQGDCYLVAGSPTGAWTSHAGDIAFYMGSAWEFIEVIEGFTAWVNDEDAFIGRTGAAWVLLSTGGFGTAGTLDFDTDGTLAANSDAKIATQKATKTYVDARVAGLSWKQAVRAASTANGTLATDFENGDTLDGVTLATGDRILLKNQSAGAENGIYVVAASGAPARSTDADIGAELVNASVYISEGTINADTQWTCTTNAAITIGSTSLTFAQFISSSYNDEAARDAVGAALTDNGLAVVTVNDGGDTIDINVPAAAGSDFRTKTDATKALTSDAVWDAAAAVALTDGATVTPDFAAGINFTWTIGGNRTLANPSNIVPGQNGCIEITQDGTGTRTIAYGSDYRFAGGTDIVLSTAAGALDLLFYYVTAGGKIFLSAQKAIAA
jgi:Protein of unknown function (DUF2793)